MERLKIESRQNWAKEIEALGFDFYTTDGVPYWGEDACYRFTAAEVDAIEEAANELHKLCLFAVQRIVEMRLFPLLGIDPEVGQLITDGTVNLSSRVSRIQSTGKAIRIYCQPMLQISAQT